MEQLVSRQVLHCLVYRGTFRKNSPRIQSRQIQVSTDLLLLGDVAVREVDKLRALHMDQNFSSEGDRLVLFAMVK